MRLIYETQKHRLPVCIGVVIRKHRERRKLTLPKFASLAGFYCTFIRDVESGRTDAYIWQLRRISKALGMSFERVLKQAGREARMDADRLKRMTRLAARYPTRRDEV